MKNNFVVLSLMSIIVFACSDAKKDSEQTPNDSNNTPMKFTAAAEWCQSWELDCSQEGPFAANIAEFVGKIFLAAGETDTKLSLNADDLRSAEVKEAATLISATDTIDDILEIAGALGVDSVTLENGQLKKSGSAGSYSHVNIN